MNGTIFTKSIDDFNNAVKNSNSDDYLVCFLGERYYFDETYNDHMINIFTTYPLVSALYADVKDNIISFPPFAPNKYFASFILDSPIIVRTSIGEYMDSESYNEYFEKIRFKKMSYHLPFPLFIKI